MKKLLVVLVLVGLAIPLSAETPFWFPIQGKEAERVLVPGNPPLTLGKMNSLINCIEFGLSVALTQNEIEGARAALMQEYLSFKGRLLSDLDDIQRLWLDVLQAPADQKGKFRLILRDSLMEEMKKQPGHAFSQVLQRLLEDSEQVFCQGNPPISKRSVTAFLEIVKNALRIRDKRVVAWTPSETANIEAEILKIIPNLNPDGRKWLGNADLHNAIIFRNLQSVPADERETVKRFLVETFAPLPKGTTQFPVAFDEIPLPPPNFFPLPTDLPWDMR